MYSRIPTSLGTNGYIRAVSALLLFGSQATFVRGTTSSHVLREAFSAPHGVLILNRITRVDAVLILFALQVRGFLVRALGLIVATCSLQLSETR